MCYNVSVTNTFKIAFYTLGSSDFTSKNYIDSYVQAHWSNTLNKGIYCSIFLNVKNYKQYKCNQWYNKFWYMVEYYASYKKKIS